mmetsp:Transcript_10220/g.32367  ORF Transcript_10220/g.32367 Transcript_10220/m.32367 type:complete len:588 (+) Transcript_10220:669-2432(+)
MRQRKRPSGPRRRGRGTQCWDWPMGQTPRPWPLPLGVMLAVVAAAAVAAAVAAAAEAAEAATLWLPLPLACDGPHWCIQARRGRRWGWSWRASSRRSLWPASCGVWRCRTRGRASTFCTARRTRRRTSMPRRYTSTSSPPAMALGWRPPALGRCATPCASPGGECRASASVVRWPRVSRTWATAATSTRWCSRSSWRERSETCCWDSPSRHPRHQRRRPPRPRLQPPSWRPLWGLAVMTAAPTPRLPWPWPPRSSRPETQSHPRPRLAHRHRQSPRWVWTRPRLPQTPPRPRPPMASPSLRQQLQPLTARNQMGCARCERCVPSSSALAAPSDRSSSPPASARRCQSSSEAASSRTLPSLPWRCWSSPLRDCGTFRWQPALLVVVLVVAVEVVKRPPPSCWTRRRTRSSPAPCSTPWNACRAGPSHAVRSSSSSSTSTSPRTARPSRTWWSCSVRQGRCYRRRGTPSCTPTCWRAHQATTRSSAWRGVRRQARWCSGRSWRGPTASRWTARCAAAARQRAPLRQAGAALVCEPCSPWRCESCPRRRRRRRACGPSLGTRWRRLPRCQPPWWRRTTRCRGRVWWRCWK